jgi:hypothetical protein
LLSFQFSPEGLSVAEETIEKFLVLAVRVYEKEQEEPSGSPMFGLYMRWWKRWVRTIGVDHCV